MNHRLFLHLILAALAGAFSFVQAQSAPPAKAAELIVSVEVENVSRDRNDNSTTETKRLKITVQNRNKEAVAGNLNWKMLGRDVQSRDLKAVGGDVAKVNLAPGESKVIEGVPVAFTEKEGKTTKTKGKKGGTKTAPDTGVGYKGYFVEIHSGDALIGSAYSPGMKEAARDLFVRPASKPPAKKKKK
jgi:hypothetical protein